MPPRRAVEERVTRTLDRLTPGTLRGTLDQAARPITDVGELKSPTSGGGGGGGPLWHMAGPVVVATFDSWPATTDEVFDEWRARLTVAGTTATTVQIAKNGVAVVTFEIAAGAPAGEASVAVAVADGDYLTAAVTGAGVGAIGLTIRGA